MEADLVAAASSSIRSPWLLKAFGVLLFLIGAVLAICGIVLASAGCSFYYLIAGLGLLVAGVQL